MHVANNNKLYLIFLGVVCVIIVAFISIVLINTFSTKKTQPTSYFLPSPTPIAVTFSYRNQKGIPTSPLEKTMINKTTDQEIKQKFTILKTTQLANGVTIYTVKSELPALEDQIYTQNGVVVFDSTSIFTIKYGDLPLLSQFEAHLGQPEEIVERNKEYGWAISNYLFPKKGYLLVANKFTKEVYEVDRFTPMTLAQFKQQYGADYLQQSPPPNQTP